MIQLYAIQNNNKTSERTSLTRRQPRVGLTMTLLALIFMLWSCCERVRTEHPAYKHYSRQPSTEPIYTNTTNADYEDDSNMCHLSVRCPAIPTLCA